MKASVLNAYSKAAWLFKGESLFGSDNRDRSETSNALTCALLNKWHAVQGAETMRASYVQNGRPFVGSEDIEADVTALRIHVGVKHARGKFALLNEVRRRAVEAERAVELACGGSLGYFGPNLSEILYSRPS